jgi:hypothetical protein
MSRESRLQEVSEQVGELVDRRVEQWEDYSALLRSILEGRTGDGELQNHLVTLTIPYFDQTVTDLLGQGNT